MTNRTLVALVGAATLTIGTAGIALAHVTVQPDEAVAGSFSRFVVRVPNERDDAATIRVEVEFPPLASVSFQPKQGWTRTVEMRELDEPLELFGEEITEVVGSVTWEGGEIAPGEFEEFGFSIRTPDEETTLEFPALQTYDAGEVVRWIGPEDSEEPAARMAIVDLGAEEGQGELAVLAELNRADAADEPDAAEAAGETEDAGAPALVTYAALALAVAALVLALMRKGERT